MDLIDSFDDFVIQKSGIPAKKDEGIAHKDYRFHIVLNLLIQFCFVSTFIISDNIFKSQNYMFFDEVNSMYIIYIIPLLVLIIAQIHKQINRNYLFRKQKIIFVVVFVVLHVIIPFEIIVMTIYSKYPSIYYVTFFPTELSQLFGNLILLCYILVPLVLKDFFFNKLNIYKIDFRVLNKNDFLIRGKILRLSSMNKYNKDRIASIIRCLNEVIKDIQKKRETSDLRHYFFELNVLLFLFTGLKNNFSSINNSNFIEYMKIITSTLEEGKKQNLPYYEFDLYYQTYLKIRI